MRHPIVSRKYVARGLLLCWLYQLLRLHLLGGRLGDEALQEFAFVNLMADGEDVVPARQVHQLLEMVATVFH